MLSVVLMTALCAPFQQPTRVDEVRVDGLWFSREATVLRELTFHPGESVTAEQWDLFEARLWNLGIFSRVELKLVSVDEKNALEVHLEDRFPIGPIIRANFGGGQFFIWAGIADVNLFGRALEVRGFYERFGSQNGFHLHVMDPRFLDQRLMATLEGEWLSRPQPEFIVRRAAARMAFEASPPGVVDDRVRLGFRLEFNSDELTPVNGQPTPVNSKALFAGPYLRLGRLDVDRLRYSSGFLEVRGDLLLSTDKDFPIANSGQLEAQYYWKLGERFNVATRLLGAIEAGARPQDRFYIGGLSQVRGYAYSEIRASAWSAANVELRFIAFDSTWFAVMPIAFVDGGVARRDTGAVQPLGSFGAGLRLIVPRLPRFGARLEVAFPFASTPLTPLFKPGINFGVWHYF